MATKKNTTSTNSTAKKSSRSRKATVEKAALHPYKPLAQLQTRYKKDEARGAKRIAQLEMYGLERAAFVAKQIQELYHDMGTLLSGVNPDWRPARSVTGSPIASGSVVVLNEKGAEAWPGVIPEGTELTVAGFVKNRVLCSLPEQAIQFPILRHHLRSLRPASAPAEATAE